MRKGIARPLALAAALLLAGPAGAGGGVDPASIAMRDWGGKRPASITVIGCEPQPPVIYSVDFSGINKFGSFVWHGQPELSAQGASLMKRNEFVEKGDLGNRNVYETYLGDPDGLLAHVPEHRHGPLSCEVIREQLFKIPAGVRKALLLRVDVGHKMLDPGTRNKINGFNNRLLTLVFEDVSDADLRAIAYEDGVLRAFRFRED